MPENPPPLPSLDELQRKIDAASPKASDKEPSVSGGLGKAMRHSLDVIAGVGVGGTMGYFLDNALGTTPLLLIVLFLLGFVSGMYNIVRSANRD